MSLETLSPEEIDSIVNENVNISQESEILVNQESVDNFKDIIKRSKENSIDSSEDVKTFFQEHQNDSELVFEARCVNELVTEIRHTGMNFFKAKETVKEQEALDLNCLIGEVIKDAFSHTPEREKYKFIVQIKIDPKNPTNYSFLVLNSSTVLTKDFAAQDKDNGLGNIIKKSLADDLGGVIRNIDIISKEKKIYHGFEFKKGEF